MTLSKQVHLNNYLPIPTLFKLGDPFLILKLCMTNKDAFNYANENISIIKNTIELTIENTNYDDEVDSLLFDIIYEIRKKDLNYNLLFLKHLLDYQIYKETKKLNITNTLISNGLDETALIQDYFILFFGTAERIQFFYRFVDMTDTRSWIYETFGGYPLTPGVVCYALAMEFNFRDVKKYMRTLLSKYLRRKALLLYYIDFNMEYFEI